MAPSQELEQQLSRSPGSRPWTCLSCLLTQVYQLFCRAGPEGDALFFQEVEQTKFERVSGAITADQMSLSQQHGAGKMVVPVSASVAAH